MLKIEGLNQYYGGSHTLRDVGLEAPAGACTVLLGRNGVGKTTLLKCLMGLLPVRAGSIHFHGEDITRLPPHLRARRGIAYVPQGREIFSRLSVEENLRLGMTLHAPRAKTLPQDVLALFPVLKDMLQRRGGDLSGGQQQQLAIARALLTRPRLLILDEPTEGIQPSIIKDIERVIRGLAGRSDIAILLVEQYYDFAHALADRYLVMARGQIVKSGLGATMDSDNVRRYVAI